MYFSRGGHWPPFIFWLIAESWAGKRYFFRIWVVFYCVSRMFLV